jgi:hypothetical protein
MTINQKNLFMTGIFLFIFIFTTFSQEKLSSIEESWLKKAAKSEKNGWIYLHIEGKPFERGFQHGYLMAKEISEAKRIEKFMINWNTGKEYPFFVEKVKSMFKSKIDQEYMEEIEGIAIGAKKAGEDIKCEDILWLNASIEILGYWYPANKDNYIQPHKTGGCSAFIATNNVTEDKGILLAHNTWSHYPNGYYNIIIDLLPEQGARIMMQTIPGGVHSETDFFITNYGIIGTETTIESFKGFDTAGIPEFVRIRKAMQYAHNIDEFSDIMIKGNNGGYANTWLFGDIKTGEIARLELGLINHSLERTFDGYYTGSNITLNRQILRDETNDDIDDIRNSNIARKVRWHQLFKKYYGKINTETAKIMLSDHYDVYLKKEIPNSRSICGHGDLDPAEVYSNWAKPYDPLGAVDAKIVDSKLAKEMKILAKWGSACDIPFNAEKFLDEHPQYDYLKGYIKDRPAKPWTLFECSK